MTDNSLLRTIRVTAFNLSLLTELWQSVSDAEVQKLWRKITRENDGELSFDGAGCFYRVGLTIWRTQYGGVSRIKLPNKETTSAMWDLIQDNSD